MKPSHLPSEEVFALFLHELRPTNTSTCTQWAHYCSVSHAPLPSPVFQAFSPHAPGPLPSLIRSSLKERGSTNPEG